MLIEIMDDEAYLNAQQVKLIEEVLVHTGKYLNLNEETEVDVTIVDNDTIHQLNLDYRGIDRPTDVLSFALFEGDNQINDLLQSQEGIAPHLGDIIISYPKIVEQAKEYGHSFERELAFLTVHGFLHLNGYDHQTPEEEKEMFGLQDEVLRTYGLVR